MKLQELNRLDCFIKLAAPMGTADSTDTLLEYSGIEKSVLHAEESVNQPDLGSLGRAFKQRVVV